MEKTVVSLRRIIDIFGYRVICDFGKIDQTNITVADVTRPGLQLAGHFKHFGANRIQLIGNMEMAYLESLSSQDRATSFDRLFSRGIPCLILSRDHEPFPELLESARKYEIPILQSIIATADITSSLVKYLNVELAPVLPMHGVMVEVLGEGILILGESGVGKSETALELVKRGHRLIADDLVEVRRVSDTTLLGRAPENIRHMIEIRGLGILDVKEMYGVSAVKLQENVDFIINLEFWVKDKEYKRIGVEDECTKVLGVTIPSITVPVRPGRNLAVIVEFAAVNHRNRQMGHDAIEELTDRIYNRKSEGQI